MRRGVARVCALGTDAVPLRIAGIRGACEQRRDRGKRDDTEEHPYRSVFMSSFFSQPARVGDRKPAVFRGRGANRVTVVTTILAPPPARG
jgi:hypothetical protein